MLRCSLFQVTVSAIVRSVNNDDLLHIDTEVFCFFCALSIVPTRIARSGFSSLRYVLHPRRHDSKVRLERAVRSVLRVLPHSGPILEPFGPLHKAHRFLHSKRTQRENGRASPRSPPRLLSLRRGQADGREAGSIEPEDASSPLLELSIGGVERSALRVDPATHHQHAGPCG